MIGKRRRHKKMNDRELELSLEFENHLEGELGIRKTRSTGVSAFISMDQKKINRTTKTVDIDPVVWVVSVFAYAKDGRFKAKASTTYNMRQVGGKTGAMICLSDLLYNSLNEQEEIETRRLIDENLIHVGGASESLEAAR